MLVVEKIENLFTSCSPPTCAHLCPLVPTAYQANTQPSPHLCASQQIIPDHHLKVITTTITIFTTIINVASIRSSQIFVSHRNEINEVVLMYMATQIADGMRYLDSFQHIEY